MKNAKRIIAAFLSILMIVTTIPVTVIPTRAATITCFQQTDSRWADVKYGYSDVNGSSVYW